MNNDNASKKEHYFLIPKLQYRKLVNRKLQYYNIVNDNLANMR